MSTELRSLERDERTGAELVAAAGASVLALAREAEAELGVVRRLAESVRRRSEAASEAFPDLDALRAGEAARTNIRAVLDQVELYHRVPARARKLAERLSGTSAAAAAATTKTNTKSVSVSGSEVRTCLLYTSDAADD